MDIYKIPEDLQAIIFDIDSTLYTNSAYAFEQVDCQVREYARMIGISAAEARQKVADYRKEYAREHNGSKISLGNIMVAFGMPISQSIAWRRELLEPANFLSRDQQLIDTLKQLQTKYKLICVTNNPILPARKTLEAIGVSEFFPEIVGLDTCNKSKPAVEPFMTAVERLGCKPENCLSVGDRYDVDVSLPLELGMGGIVVSGVEEVYNLVAKLVKV